MAMEYLEKSKKYKIIIYTVISALLWLYPFLHNWLHRINDAKKAVYLDRILIVDRIWAQEGLHENIMKSNLIPPLRYREIDEERLRQWLYEKQSILTEEVYVRAILNTSKAFDISPLLLFAIIGQEQGFVPKDHPKAEQIASNPFNVYGSWQTYHTDIQDSANIAAKTILRLNETRPIEEDPIYWINTRGGMGGYAVDENWWIGVSKILDKMEKEIAQEKEKVSR